MTLDCERAKIHDMTENPLSELARLPRRIVEIRDLDGPSLARLILDKGGTINPPGKNVLALMQKPEVTGTIEVVRFQLSDIGFRLRENDWAYGAAARQMITAGLENHGLQLCPPQTAAMMAVAGAGSIQEHYAVVLSHPIIDGDGDSLIFYYSCSGEKVSQDAYGIGAFWDNEFAIAQVTPQSQ